MKPSHNMETLLRGCRLRPPSPRVRRALFGETAARRGSANDQRTPGDLPAEIGARTWFAPFTAAALVALSLATAWAPTPAHSHDTFSAAAAAASWTGAIQHNAPPTSRFRSTNAGTIAASFGSLLIRQTNVLAR